MDVANAMLDKINDERDGAVISRELIKSCVQLFEAMGMGCLDAYTMDFEEKLLASTQEYYARKSASWIAEDEPGIHGQGRGCTGVRETRVENYLNHNPRQLLDVVEKEILEKREQDLLKRRVQVYGAQNDKHEDSRACFACLGRGGVATTNREHREAAELSHGQRMCESARGHGESS